MKKKLTAVIICVTLVISFVFPVNAFEFSDGEPERIILSDSFETSEEDDYQGVFSDGKQEKDDDNIFVTDIESEDSIWSDGEEPEEIEQDSLPENAVAYINPLYQDVITEEDLKRPQEGLLNASDDVIYYTNVEDIVSEIRAQLVKRETVIAVGYQSSENYVPDFIDMAMEHTGSPLEGDYLKWQYAGCWKSCSVNLTNDIYYHTIKYTVTYYTTYQQEQALNRSISLLLEDLNLRQKTDYEKIKSIYDFICSNVSYDYYHLNDEAYTLKYTAYAALVNKSAVCQGYAVLFYRLALEAGVDCRVISGISMGERHGWNIVKLWGMYYAVDSTWDAGYSHHYYFLKGSLDFDKDHIRDSQYKDNIFQSNYPTSVNDYVVQTDDLVSEEEYVENDIIYTIQHGTATVTGYLGKPEVVTIPEKVKNAVVIKIGKKAFSKCITLKKITIPATIRTIEDGNWVFGNEDLQWGAFWHCENLSEVIIAPNSKMNYIGAYSFCGCTALKSFSLPSSIKELGNNVFDACSSITEIELPEGIEKIGFYAFADTAITEIKIPASCEQYLASYLLTQKKYTVADGNTVYKAIDGVLFTRYEQGWMLDAYPASRDDNEYTVPEDIEYVDGYSFQYNEKLCQINIGNQTVFNQSCIKCSINFVGDLTDYVNEDGLIYSKDGKRLIKIESEKTGTIVVKDGVETIDNAAGYKGNFTEIILPEGVTRIGSGAFAESALEKIQFSNTLKIVENQAFYSCRNLKEIELPDSISEIQSQAFQDCASLVRAKLPAGLKILRWNTFFDCVSLEEVIMPKVLEETEFQVFANCEKIQSIILPNTLNKIGDKMFLCCSNLKQFTIPEQVTEIGCGAFRQCRTLQKIRIPEKTGYIGGDAFTDCDLLQEIVVDAENPAYASLDGVLYNKQVTELIQWPGGKKGKLTIPSSVEKISEAEGAFMGSYDYILSALSCASGMTDIEVESGNKYYASSDGILYDKEKKILILCPQGKTGCVIVPEGIVSIGKRAFYKCHNISEVRLPSTLTDIEYNGFDECISLHTISLPNGLRKIGDGAFSSSGLGSGNMILPDTVEYIGEYAFANCSYPDRLVIPKSVQYIGKGAFAGYNNPEIKKEIIFTGDYPETFDRDAFLWAYVTVYYPADNPTWKDNLLMDYGGTLTWKKLCTQHQYDEGRILISPDCITKGQKVFTCKVCGASDKYQEIPELGHDWGEWRQVQAPTAEKEGQETRTCQRCEKTESRTIGKCTQHQYDEGKVLISPDCITKGQKVFTCKVCGASDKYQEIPELGHDWGAWRQVQAPTVKTEGQETRTCQRCKRTESRIIAKLPLKLGTTILNKPTVISGDYIKISWKAVENADGYYVYRIKNSKWEKIATCKRNTLYYIDKSTKIGTTYKYTVKAYATSEGKTVYGGYNKSGVSLVQSLYKDVVKLKELKPLSSKSFKISWTARSKADGYIIYRKVPGGSWKRVATVGKVSSYTDKSCNSATTYTYTVKAYAKNTSKNIYSNYNKTGITATTFMLTPKVTVKSTEKKKAVISWTKQSNVTGCIVYRKDGVNSSWKKIKTVNSKTSTITDSGLKSSKSYYYMVRAYKKADIKNGIPKTLYGPYNKNGIKVKIK